jgi:hypothetical protein
LRTLLEGTNLLFEVGLGRFDDSDGVVRRVEREGELPLLLVSRDAAPWMAQNPREWWSLYLKLALKATGGSGHGPEGLTRIPGAVADTLGGLGWHAGQVSNRLQANVAACRDVLRHYEETGRNYSLFKDQLVKLRGELDEALAQREVGVVEYLAG